MLQKDPSEVNHPRAFSVITNLRMDLFEALDDKLLNKSYFPFTSHKFQLYSLNIFEWILNGNIKRLTSCLVWYLG